MLSFLSLDTLLRFQTPETNATEKDPVMRDSLHSSGFKPQNWLPRRLRGYQLYYRVTGTVHMNAERTKSLFRARAEPSHFIVVYVVAVQLLLLTRSFRHRRLYTEHHFVVVPIF